MSCSVIGIPWLLAWVIGGLITTAVNKNGVADENFQSASDEENNFNDIEVDGRCNDVYVISEKEILEKSFETPFVDKNLLLKTLEEHGVVDIKENEYGQIKGVCDKYELCFERVEPDKPYYAVIKYLSTESAEEKMNDLTSEYAINVQEEAYNSIVKKLQENNMEIENEEVTDDNTIVLTINLE